MAKSQHITSLSNLILAVQDKEEGMKRVTNRRTTQQLKAKLFEKSREAEPESQSWGNPMKRVRVKSNFARDRVVMLGNGQLVLHFDAQGFATMPEHQLHLLRAEMRSRPGRYQILTDAVESKKQAAKDQKPAAEMAPELKEQVKDLLGSLKAAEEAGPVPDPAPEPEAKAEEPEKDPEAEKPRRPKRRSRKKKKESTEEE